MTDQIKLLIGDDANRFVEGLTALSRRLADADAPVAPYDAEVAAELGGYPKWTVLSSAVMAGALWLSTMDRNAGNPDALGGTDGWINFTLGGVDDLAPQVQSSSKAGQIIFFKLNNPSGFTWFAIGT
jgi:hypothetical protein